ncbi:MAG: cell division protein FtsA [Chloroflexota bacterium]
MSRRIISAIDVGTTKVCTIIGNVDSHGAIQVLSVGIVPSHGMHKGIVVNPTQTARSIIESVRRAQDAAGVSIDSAYVGVTGRHITSTSTHGVVSIPRSDQRVRPQDLRRVLTAAKRIQLAPERELLTVIPRQYLLDGQEGVTNPVGMHGFRLDAETLCITAAAASVQNLVKCIRQTGIDIDDLILEPLASAEAVLTPEEKSQGVILADIGGGTTDIAVLRNNTIAHIAVVPVAGYQCTSDISIGLGLSFEVSEAMKKKYGSVVAVDKDKKQESNASITNGHSISYRDLCAIIRTRMEELFHLTLLEMPTADYGALAPAGIVLTGGASKLPGLAELGAAVTHMPVRIGRPSGVYGIVDTLGDPAYATAVGLLLWGNKNQGKPTWQGKKPRSAAGRFLSLVRKLFTRY